MTYIMVQDRGVTIVALGVLTTKFTDLDLDHSKIENLEFKFIEGLESP